MFPGTTAASVLTPAAVVSPSAASSGMRALPGGAGLGLLFARRAFTSHALGLRNSCSACKISAQGAPLSRMWETDAVCHAASGAQLCCADGNCER